MSYLPLAHVYECISFFTGVYAGAKIGFWRGSVSKLQQDAAALGPAVLVVRCRQRTGLIMRL